MSDYLTRQFKAQLTTTMDSVLRRSVFEIMKIFENSLYDHQMELARKGDEIAQLKIKLQTAEVKLTESDRGGDTGAEMYKTQMNKTQREPEGVLKTSGQTDVPEIDFEVPDDWCAPLGCETVTKQDVSVCPSIRLRQLSIPLWHVPIIKQEVVNRDIDSNQRTKGCRRSKRGSSLNKGHKHTHDRSLPMCDQGTQLPTVRNDMKILLQDIKWEYTDLTGRPTTGRRRRRRILRGKEQENTLKNKGEERQNAATETKSTQQGTVENEGEKKFSCKFCEKKFDTEFGQSVHARSHKRCRGCKKEFPFPSALKCHKPYCKKLKKLLAKKAQSTDPPKPQSCDEEKASSPSKKQVIRKESTPSSSNNRESSIQKDGSTKKHCVHCNKKFFSHCRFKEHMRVHTGEKPFPCSMCPKKFRINQSLKKHVMRMHIDQVSSSETIGDLAWTKPLEEIEDNQEDLISSNKDTSQAINHNNVQRQCSPVKKKSPGWQTMGTRCTNGFMCLVCKMRVRNKYRLTEHFYTHIGEGPIKCEKKPPPQTRYNKHTSFQDVERYHK